MAKKEQELNTRELAERWGMSEQTLRNWRSKSKGPNYTKKGNARNSEVVYKIKDIKNFEKLYFGTRIYIRTSSI